MLYIFFNFFSFSLTCVQYLLTWSILKNKHQIEDGCFVFSDGQSDIHKHSQTIENIEQRLSSLSHTDLTPRSGPIASALDTILNRHRITPQAYHSRSFVGNHCHKYRDENVYTELTETIVKQTQALSRNPFLTDEACRIQITFNGLNEAFSKVHNAMSYTKHIDHSRPPEIQSAIENYMTIYRRMFSHKIIPKQHILENHCIYHI